MNDIIKAIAQVMCGIKTPCMACGIKAHCEITHEKATSIYTTHVKPLEDALAAAKMWEEKSFMQGVSAALYAIHQARNDADIVAIELGYKSAHHVAVEANDDAFLVALASVQKSAS